LDSIIAAQQAAREACIAGGGTDCGFDLSLASLLTPQIIAAFVALGVLALAPILVKRFYRRRLKRFAGEQEGARPADG
jgi:hypothetical protein